MNYSLSITKVIRCNFNNLCLASHKWNNFQQVRRDRIKQNYLSYRKCISERSRHFEETLFSLNQIQRTAHFQSNKKTNSSLSVSSIKFHTNLISCKNKKDSDINHEEQKKTEEDLEKKMTLYQKFKLMYKRYWYVLIPVHVATSIVWYGAFFFAAKSGVDIVPLLEKMGTTEKFLSYIRDSNAGYYGIAYAMYKIATPARYTVTLGGTTLSINYLRNRGYIKPVPTKQELKVMYEDKKDELMERREEFRGRVQEKKDEFFEKYHDKTDEMKEKYTEKRKEFLGKYKISKNKEDDNEKR